MDLLALAREAATAAPRMAAARQGGPPAGGTIGVGADDDRRVRGSETLWRLFGGQRRRLGSP